MKSLKTNAVLNTIKTLMSLIFPLITFPYLSRVLGVENIGKVNFSSSVVSYFTLIAGLGVSRYAIREGASIRNNQDEIKNFISEVFSINIISTICSYIFLLIVLFFAEPLKSYTGLILLYSVEILFITIGIDWFFSVFENYLYITIRSVLVQLVTMILIIVFVRESDDYYKYVSIVVVMSCVANIINFLSARTKCKIGLVLNKKMARHLIPILTIFSISVATSIYVNSDTTMLGIFSGEYRVGIYSMSTKVYSIVKQLLAAIIIVTVPRLSYILKNESTDIFKKTASEVLNTIIVLLVPAVIGLLFNSRSVVFLLGGFEYIEAEYSLMILSIALFFTIFSSFFSMSILLPLKMENRIFQATLISAIVNVILNIFLIPVFYEKAAAFTTLISECISCFICYYYSKRYLDLHSIVSNISKCFVGTIPIILISILANMFLRNNNNFILFGVIIASAFSYFIVEILVKNTYVTELLFTLKKFGRNR